MTINPPVHGALELDVMRAGFGLAVLYSLHGFAVGFPKGFSRPVGVARVIDLGWLARRRRALHLGAQAATVAYLVDIAQTWALLYVALYLVFEVTARSSDGSVNHGHHLVTLVAIVQCVAIGLLNAAEQWDWDVDRWVADTRGDTISWWSVQAILAVYVTSGLSKVLRDRGGWVHQSPGLLLNAAIRADMVDATGSGQESARASRARRIIFWLLPHANLTRVVFAGGLLVELAAPIGLFGEHALLAVGLALLVLHWGNGLLFNLPFVGYQILVVTYLINLPQFWS